MRFFSTARPVNRQIHYCGPPLQRFDLAEVLTLIGQRKYFLLHAPRQTGKTACLLALMEHLNQEGQYRALDTKRPQHFPQSIVLCGVRDLRDYRIHSARDKAVITGGSASNIRPITVWGM